MTITPGELLETSTAQLRTLVAFLGEQLDRSAGGDTAQSSTLEVRACKDMLVSLTVVLQGSPDLVFGGERCRAKLNSNHRAVVHLGRPLKDIYAAAALYAAELSAAIDLIRRYPLGPKVSGDSRGE